MVCESYNMGMNFMYSEKGKVLLVAKSNIFTWRCIKKTGKAKIYTNGESIQINAINKCNLEHNHDKVSTLNMQEKSRRISQNAPFKDNKV